MTAPEARVFHTLDALRGIAAIGVVVFHLGPAFSPLATPGGYLAVDLFFMMSGAVLSHAYEPRFRAGMGTLDFMRARFIRLYPLYLLGTLSGAAVTLASMLGRNVMHWDSASLARTTLLGLLFLPDVSGRPVDTLFPLDIPCWSLFLEVLVNLLFVVSWRLLASSRLMAVSLVTGIAVAVAAMHYGNIDQGSTAAGLAVGLARSVFGFSVGVLIARNVRHAPGGRSSLEVLAIMAIFGLAIAGRPDGELRAIWDIACVLVVFPLLVSWGTRVDPGTRLRSVATFLGVTSYATYVLHSPLSSVLNSVTRHLARASSGSGIGVAWSGFAFLAALLAASWLVDRCFDMPFRRRLNRLVPKAGGVRAESPER